MRRGFVLLLLLAGTGSGAEEPGAGQNVGAGQVNVEATTQGVNDGPATPAKRASGRVIEYGKEAQGGVVEAKPRTSTAAGSVTGTDRKRPGRNEQSRTRQSTNQQHSVELITGGDPTQGSAKVGRLPVLD